MMPDIRRLTDSFAAAPQIVPGDVAAIRAAGFGFIVNNRPDGEAADQPAGDDIEAAALDAGLGYCAIPIDQGGFTAEQVAALSACDQQQGPILAFCRSGTRSAMLWALSCAARGADAQTLMAKAAAQGFDLAPLRAMLIQLAQEKRD
jgi:uncharacterized protein (TIGR01244 family)